MQYQPVPARPEYHRVLLGVPGSWWRLFVAILGAGIGLVVMSTLAVIAVLLVGKAFDSSFTIDLDNGIDAGEMFAVNLGLALLIPFAWLLAKVLYREPRAWVSSVRPGLRVRWLLTCVGIAAVVWALLFALVLIGAISDSSSSFDFGVVAFIIVVLVTQPLQAAGEEYLFRGVILQALGATRMPTWLCCVLDGALFATAHLQFDPPLFADRFVLGCVFSFVAIKTGGLEGSIALHTVKNLAVLIPAGLVNDTSDALDPHRGA